MVCLLDATHRKSKATDGCGLFCSAQGLCCEVRNPDSIDYVTVYELTGKIVEESLLHSITEIFMIYGQDSLQVDIIFSILYMAMIAEEQKKNTRLGECIKRL